MKLFEIIPKSLFSVLTSSNRFVYIEVLFLLLQKMDLGNLTRTEFVDILISELGDEVSKFDLFAEDEQDDDAPESSDARTFAQCVLRKLVHAGWVRMEIDVETMEETIRLPFYATPILAVLKEIEDDEIKEYASNIYGSYTALDDAQHRNTETMYMALNIADRNMRQLRQELDILDEKIYALYQRLIDEVRINTIISQHFDEYQQEYQQKFIHPLMTFDSVARFKNPINAILQQWQENREKFSLLCQQAFESNQYQNLEEAQESVRGKLVSIQDRYPMLETLVRDIGERAHRYTTRTREKMAYYLNADQSIYSDMLRVMDVLSHADTEDQQRITAMASLSFPLSTGRFIDADSLYHTNKKTREAEIPTPIVEVRQEDTALQSFLNEANQRVTEKKAREYVLGYLREKDSVQSRDMHIEDIDDFKYLMLGAISTDEEETPYRMELEQSDYDCEQYRIPDMKFIKKEAT